MSIWFAKVQLLLKKIVMYYERTNGQLGAKSGKFAILLLDIANVLDIAELMIFLAPTKLLITQSGTLMP